MSKFLIEIDHPEDCDCRLCSEQKRNRDRRMVHRKTVPLWVRIPVNLMEWLVNHPNGKKDVVIAALEDYQALEQTRGVQVDSLTKFVEEQKQ